MGSHRPKLVSFSGIDGAGKSTQIEALCRHLENHGNRFQLLAFWDDVVAFSGVREQLSLRVFKGDKGVGSPDRPIARRDKNVSSWHVVVFRLFLYLLDATRLCWLLARFPNRDADVVVFDRYIYDELANLPLRHWPMRLYVRLLTRVVPKPDLALLLDADPETAILRKPEYPLQFVRRNREAYLAVARMSGMAVLPPSSVSATAEVIRKAIVEAMRGADGSTVLPAHSPVSASSVNSPTG